MKKLLTTIILTIATTYGLHAHNSQITLAANEEDIRSIFGNWNNFSEETGSLSQPKYSLYGPAGSGANSFCVGTGTLSEIVPEPLKTYFTAAGEKHQVDPAILATIYAVENALYNDGSLDSSDWRIGKIHSNDWATSGGGAKGPMQFLDSTFAAHEEEGPYTYDGSQWTTEEGASDGISVQHADDAIFAAGGYTFTSTNYTTVTTQPVINLPLGSLDQDFSRGSNLVTVATVLRNYNAGAGSWKDGNSWYYLKNGSVTAWGPTKDAEINGYISNGLQIFAQLSGLEVGDTGNCLVAGDADFELYQGELFDHGRLMGTPKAVLLHWTGGRYAGGPDQFVDAIKSNTSCGAGGCTVQLFIDASGTIWQMVPNLETLTYHGCQANYAAIGIEIESLPGPDEATIEQDLIDNTAQKQAVIDAVTKLTELYPSIDPNKQDPISIEGILGHYETAPYGKCGGKADPGSTYTEEIRKSVRDSIQNAPDEEEGPPTNV